MRNKIVIPIIIATVIVAALAAFFINQYFYSSQAAAKSAQMMSGEAAEKMSDSNINGVVMKEGVLYSLWEGGELSAISHDVTLKGGARAMVGGKIVGADGSAIVLKDGQELTADGKVMDVDTSKLSVMEEGEGMAEGNETMEDNESMMGKDVSYSGQVIAGSETPYIRYSKADFDKALGAGKSVYVYVYATWCPTCAVERPKVMQAFDGLGESDVVGFEVHWNDGQDTQEDKDLERNYGVSSQHTSLFIGSDGKLIEKSLNSIDVAAFKAKLAAFGA
jgi:thiol-disulfide isomerase/thioredoxin